MRAKKARPARTAPTPRSPRAAPQPVPTNRKQGGTETQTLVTKAGRRFRPWPNRKQGGTGDSSSRDRGPWPGARVV